MVTATIATVVQLSAPSLRIASAVGAGARRLHIRNAPGAVEAKGADPSTGYAEAGMVAPEPVGPERR